MSTRTGARLGRVSRVTAGGDVFVELADVAPGFEFGPCVDAVGGLVKGDRIIAQGLARDADELVITGIVGGRPAPDVAELVTDDELTTALADKVDDTDPRLADARTPTAHTHHADDVDDGVLALARLPVAPSGNANATQIVRADDARLSNARTPTAHSHTMSDLPAAAAALAAYPIGAYYISHVSTSPATLFGGTWLAVTDRVLIGVGANVRWDTPGETGGSETVTLTAAQSGVPAHTHRQRTYNATLANGGGSALAGMTAQGFGDAGVAANQITDANTGANASQAHDNMPPFTAAYMWRRTA